MDPRALLLLLAGLVLLAGCTAAPPPPAEPGAGTGSDGGTTGGAPPDGAPTGGHAAAGEVAFRTVEGCQVQQATAKYAIILNQTKWAQHWEASCGGGAPPAVDFASASVVAAFWGEKPSTGHAIEVVDITVADQRAAVLVERRAPAEGCPAGDALTFPFHIVVTDGALPLDGGFRFEDRAVPC